MTIELLPGARLTPQVLLHQVLQNLEGVKGIIVLKVGETGAVDIVNSAITLHELAYAATQLQIHTNKVIGPDENLPEGTSLRPPPGAA